MARRRILGEFEEVVAFIAIDTSLSLLLRSSPFFPLNLWVAKPQWYEGEV